MASKNKVLNPQAKAGLDKFKVEVADSIGLPNYQSMDKGNLASRDNGLVGGNMVKKMIQDYENKLTNK